MTEREQKQLFNKIAPLYEAHYGDACSQRYRREFIYHPMFEDIDISGMRAVEAMCGSGETTEYLLSRGAGVTGLDISVEALKSFQRRWPGCCAVCTSILNTGLENSAFDLVVVTGGLHHLHPELNQALSEIHRILRPGGYFCFSEPHGKSLPNEVRKFWYRHDDFFASNESAIDLEKLKETFRSQFRFNEEVYAGNIAYLLVLQSMVFRIPLRLKPLYTPTLLKIESMFNKIQGKRFSCFVVCRWEKI